MKTGLSAIVLGIWAGISAFSFFGSLAWSISVFGVIGGLTWVSCVTGVLVMLVNYESDS